MTTADHIMRGIVLVIAAMMIMFPVFLALLILVVALVKRYSKPSEEWVPFTAEFDYVKKFYDVKLRSGEIIYHCWPNAGYMIDINGSGFKFGPEDEIQVRRSRTHPEDDPET